MLARPVALVLAASLSVASCGSDETSPAPPRGYDARAYALSGRFDWTARRLDVTETVTLVLGAAASPKIELDSLVDVKRVYAGGTDLPFTVDADHGLLRVDLDAVAKGDRSSPIKLSIDYQAPTTSALTASSGRDADPVTSRAVYTDSEPNRAHLWLPCNDRPDDRAAFSVELTVAADEDVIANGERVRDEAQAGGRVVGYRMDDPIPTYLMAFAAGQLSHRDRAGQVPLSVWYRRGLLIDAERHLDVVADAMATYQRLIGPYPFARYSVVLVPVSGGGMENATITFNVETSGQGEPSFSLNAHELAHQWFGDWVTVESFDDVWVKESMATLLAAEATRARRDDEHRGRLFGFDFPFNKTDAIRDLSLPVEQRYTSGPYERGAWLLTQIRAKIGDQAFFRHLRAVLDEHRLGNIDSESFIGAFAPELDAASVTKAITALAAKTVPSLRVDTTPQAGATAFTLHLDDPGGTMLVPLDVTVVDGNGAATVRPLAAGAALDVVVPADGYIALDEKDVHPNWPSALTVDATDYFSELAPRFVPNDPEAFAAFGSRSAAAQERALWALSIPFDAGELAGFYAALDSRTARYYAQIDACRGLRAELPQNAVLWRPALDPILRAPAQLTISTLYGACGTTLAQEVFGAELAGLAADPTSGQPGRIGYVMSFDFGAQQSLDAIARIATTVPSTQIRDQAISRLSLQAQAGNNYTTVPADQKPAWQAFFRDRLAESTSYTRFRLVWRGVRGLADDRALPLAGAALQRIPMTDLVQRGVVCDSRTLSAARTGAWEEFQAAAQPWDRLSQAAQQVLRDPSACSQ